MPRSGLNCVVPGRGRHRVGGSRADCGADAEPGCHQVGLEVSGAAGSLHTRVWATSMGSAAEEHRIVGTIPIMGMSR